MSTTQIKNTFISIGGLDASIPPSSLMLQLAVTRASISYIIQSLSHKQVVFYGEYQLHHVESDADLVRRLEKIHQSDEVLQLNFGKVIIGVDPAYSLVPANMPFDIQSTDGILLRNNIEPLELDLVFDIEIVLNYKLKYLFPDCAVQHLGASLLSGTFEASASNEDLVFVNLTNEYFDIIRFNTVRQLQLMNRYTFETDTDMLYFVLLCGEQLQINREETTLILSGNIEQDSSYFSLFNKYFRNIRFAKPGSDLQFSKAFDSFPRHQHIHLYNLEQA